MKARLFALLKAHWPLVTVLLLCGCKAHFEEEVQRHQVVASASESDRQVDTHIVDAPDRTTTTVEEFAPLPESPAVREDGEPQDQRAAEQVHDLASAHAGTVPEHGPLVKRTVTVLEHGAVTIDRHVDAKSQERDDTVLDDRHKLDEGVDFLHSPFTLIGALVVAGGVALAIWKLRKAVPL